MVHHHSIDYENVTLRPLDKNDIERLRNWRNDPHNTQFLSKIPYITSDAQESWFESYLSNQDEIAFAIIENQHLKRLVGSLSLYGFSPDFCIFGKILIGDEEAHGRKIGLNATIAATKIAFEQMGLKRVNLYVYSNHNTAISIYKKAGFSIVDEHESADHKREYTMTMCREQTGGMQRKKAVQMLEFQKRGDERGHLVIVEGNQDIPFEIKRAFYIYGSDSSVIRGQHANRESEFVLINVAGKSKVKVKDGLCGETVYCLDRPHTGIYLPAMIWKEMYDFSPDSVLLVLASTHYYADEYIRNYDDFVKEIMARS